MWNPRSLPILLVTLVLTPAWAPAQQGGQQLFSSTCAACHGLDGRGGEHAPNIATDPRIQALTDRGLLHVIKTGIPNSGMPAFGAALNDDQIRAVVAYLRILQSTSKAASLPGNAETGGALFFGSAKCSQCHTINGRGGFIGSDLSSYGGTHTPDEIRHSIVDPDSNQDPRHGTITVVLKTGVKYTGLIRNEDNFSLQLQTPDGDFHLVDKSKLKSIQYSPKSIMPSDYQSSLGNQAIDDLISYLVKTAASAKSAVHDEEE